MNKIAKRSLLLILSLCFVLSLGCFAFFSSAKAQQVKADSEYDADAFEMYNGASVGIYKDGLRFIVKMGRDVYQEVLDSENLTLSFLVAPKSYFDAVDAGANPGKYENLSNKVKIDVDKDKIYTNKSYYYANGVLTNLDHNNRSSGTSDQYDYEFVAVAMIKNSTTGATRYAAFSGNDIDNNTRTQYNVLQAAMLNENADTVKDLLNSTISPYTTWFGGDAHPLWVETAAKYDKYAALVDEGCDFSNLKVKTRTDDEYDTVAFLCDRDIGAKQFWKNPLQTEDKITISYSTKKSWSDEAGSVKFSFDGVNTADHVNYIYYQLLDGYDANRKGKSPAYNSKYAGKYVAFNVYNDTDADYIEVSMGNYFWFRVPRGEWRPVVWPADSLWRSGTIVILGFEYSDGDIKPYGYNSDNGIEPTRVALNGDVYLSKATVVNYEDTDNVEILGGSGAAISDSTVTVGNTAVDQVYWNTIGGASDYTPSCYSSSAVSGFYGKTAYVDGSIMAYGVSYETRDYAIWFRLAEAVEAAQNKVMYVTVKGVHSDSLLARSYVSGTVNDCYGSIVETDDDGFVTYAFYFGRHNTSLSGNLTGFYLFVLNDYGLTHIDEVEVKDITIADLDTAAAAVRAVEGSDTVFMFDNALGVGQVRSNQVKSIKFNPDMHIEGENGSLELDYAGNNVGYLGYSFLDGAETMDSMDSSKYVVFYAYNDTDADVVDIEITSGYKYRFRIPNGEWSMVIWSADNVNNGHFWIRFEAYDFNGDYESPSFTSKNVNGKIYLSKAVLLDADEVYQTPTANDDSEYIRIGSVDLDSVYWIYHGDYNPNSAAFNSPTYSNMYYVNGVLRGLSLPSSTANTDTKNGFKFYLTNGGVYRQNNKLYVTIKGADEDTIFLYGYNATGASLFGSVSGVKEQTLPDGFEIYSFDISQIGTSYYNYKSLAFALITDTSLKKPDMNEIVIKDMWFASQRTALENAIDFFVDVPTGRDIKVLQITDTQIIDTSTMREGAISDKTSISSYRNTADHDSLDIYCFKYLREIIAETQPDFIIMTGDNTYGKFDDDGHMLIRLIECMESFGIPWAPIIGNHDAGTALGIDWICEQYEKAEHCLFKQRSLSGNGNYTVGIRQGGELKRLFVMMDSNGYSDNADKSNGHTYYTRGFAPDQIEWYTNTINAVKAIVPNVKISFAFHIQMQEFYLDINRAYGDEIAPTGYYTDYHLSIDALGEDKQEGDFGFDGEYYSTNLYWYKNITSGEESVFTGLDEATIYAGMKALGVDSIFVGHAHQSSSSVVYDGVRVQFGLKSSRHDYLQIVYRATGQYTAWATRFWLDNHNTDTTLSPIIGGSVLSLSATDGSIGDDGYSYFCTGAGKGLDPSTWNPSGS